MRRSSVWLGVGVAYSPREYQHGAGGGDVSDVEFSIDGGHVAVSIGNVVLVLNTQVWNTVVAMTTSAPQKIHFVVCRAGYWILHS